MTPQPVAPQPVAPPAAPKTTKDERQTGPVPLVASSGVSEDTAVTSAGLETPRPKRKKKKRSAGFDALAELEKLRKETVKVKGSQKNGKQELNQDFSLTLKKSALDRAQRFSLTLQLEDAERRVLDEVQHLHVDLDSPQALDRLLLRLNIHLDSTS